MLMQRKKSQTISLLTKEWYARLRASGFLDIEDKYQRLKQYDRRTQSFDDRDLILNFFLQLDMYLNDTEINSLHRKILELYSEGKKVTDISKIIKRSRARVNQIIRLHKNLILRRN